MEASKEQNTEKDEIVRGFIIEKDYINQEHEKEKKEIVDSFIQDREELIDKFNEKVLEIERKFSNKERKQAQNDVGPKLHRKRGAQLRSSASSGLPFFFNFGADNTLTPEEFLANFQLEEKFENEQVGLERSYRDERRILREKLEIECHKKLQFQRMKYEANIEDLKRIIKDLKFEKEHQLEDFKQRLDDFEISFEDRKRNLESKHMLEQNRLRDSLEMKHSKDIEAHRANYERLSSELKDDRRRDKELMADREREMSRMFEKKVEEELKLRREMSENMKNEFKIEFEKVSDEKHRLNEQVLGLTHDKAKLADQIKQFQDTEMNKLEVLDEFSNRLNKEYEERLKKAVLENEHFRMQLEKVRDENSKHVKTLKRYEKEFEVLEDKTLSKDKLVVGYENKISSLRDENNQLSREIFALRKENEEAAGLIDNYRGSENLNEKKLTDMNAEIEKVLDRFKISERERLNLERKISLLNREVEQGQYEKEMLERKLKLTQNEVETGNRLLLEERKEHDRLNERFVCDAEELRKKDTECNVLKDKLRIFERKVQSDIDSAAEKVDNTMLLEAQNSELRNKLTELELRHEASLRAEREAIQKQFAKEFAKRLQSLRRNYEDATDGLIRQIRELRRKITDLESSIHSKPDKAVFRNVTFKRHQENGLYDEYNDKKISTSPIHIDNYAQSKHTKASLIADDDCDLGYLSTVNNADTQREAPVPATNRDLSHPSNHTFDMAASLQDQLMWRSSNYPSASASHGQYSESKGRDDAGRINSTSEKMSQDRKLKSRLATGHDRSRLGVKQEHTTSRHDSELNQNGHPLSNEPYEFHVDRGTQPPSFASQTHKSPLRTNADHVGQLSSLPPLPRPSSSRKLTRDKDDLSSSVYSREPRHAHPCSATGHPKSVENDSHAENLERSVKKLQERLETSHSEMLQRIENIQKSENSEASHKPSEKDVPCSKGKREDKELQNLLKDVRSEVTRFNQLLEKHKKPKVREDKDKNAANSTENLGDLWNDSSANEVRHDLKIIENEATIARRYAADLHNQLHNKKLELDDTSEALQVVYKSQNELAAELLKNNIDLPGEDRGNSYKAKIKEKLFVDKLVAKLQEKLDGQSRPADTTSVRNVSGEDDERFSDELSV